MRAVLIFVEWLQIFSDVLSRPFCPPVLKATVTPIHHSNSSPNPWRAMRSLSRATQAVQTIRLHSSLTRVMLATYDIPQNTYESWQILSTNTCTKNCWTIHFVHIKTREGRATLDVACKEATKTNKYTTVKPATSVLGLGLGKKDM